MMNSNIRHITNATLPYLLSVPSGTPPSSGWPVLCFLHGYEEAADRYPIEEALTKHGPLRSCNPKRVMDEFIVIAPQLPVAGEFSWFQKFCWFFRLSTPNDSPGDKWREYSDVVKDIVSSVRQEFHGDSHRTYLTGFSFGANGVIDLAAAQTNFWAAYWPVDPTRAPQHDLGKPVWLSMGSIARRDKPAHIRVSRLELPSMTPLSQDRVYLDQGLDHVETAASAYSDSRIYDWLLSKRLEKPEE